MKGLLIKDLKLMLTQKMFLILIPLIGAAITVPGGQITTGFGYITAISGIFAVTTINYDSYNNGFPFLFTFPVSRREYVKEKYVFAILSSAVYMTLTGALVWIMMTAVHPGGNYQVVDFLKEMSGCYLTALVVIAILLPVYLKYGAEKSRYVIFALVGVFAGVLAAISLGDGLELMKLAEVKRGALLIMCLALLAVSYALSCRVVEKKDF